MLSRSATFPPSTPVPAARLTTPLVVAGSMYAAMLALFAANGEVFQLTRAAVVPALSLAAACSGRFSEFLRDWAVFLSLIVGYDVARGLALTTITNPAARRHEFRGLTHLLRTLPAAARDTHGELLLARAYAAQGKLETAVLLLEQAPSTNAIRAQLETYRAQLRANRSQG